MSLSISYLSLLMLLMMIGLSVVQADTVDCNLSLTQADGDPRAFCKTWSGARFGQNSKEYTCPADQCSQVIGTGCHKQGQVEASQYDATCKKAYSTYAWRSPPRNGRVQNARNPGQLETGVDSCMSTRGYDVTCSRVRNWSTCTQCTVTDPSDHQ